jgi:hypothetical protein
MIARGRWWLLLLALTAAWSGCAPSSPAAAAVPAAPNVGKSATRPAGAAASAPLAMLTDGSELAIAAGSVVLGSRPGTPLRDPSTEADLVSVELPAFAIDALPYPNEAGQPARTAVSRDEANALCEARGKRLCSELEWERACKGPADSTFTTGDKLDLARCKAQPSTCRSSEGVLGLGIALREWTGSDAPAGLGNPSRTAVARGATLAMEAPAHRCAARNGLTADSRADDLGLRCCRGSAQTTNKATYPVEPERPFTRPLAFDQRAARAELEKVPELAAYAPSFTLFDDAAADAALRRGGASRSGISLWQFQPSAVAWSPMPGEELHVLSGRTAQGALLAVIHAHADGRLSHAASTVIAEPEATIAVGGSAEHARQLIFTTCYGCPGEGGTIRFGDDARVELGYR